MNVVKISIIAGFTLFLATGIAGADELDDLDVVTIRVVETDDDINEVEHELSLPEHAADEAREHAEEGGHEDEGEHHSDDDGDREGHDENEIEDHESDEHENSEVEDHEPESPEDPETPEDHS